MLASGFVVVMSAVSAISLKEISKRFVARGGNDAVEALSALDLEIRQNSFVSLVGRSGCGKSTLLRIIAGLEVPTTGTIQIMGASQQDYRRNSNFGFVFQDAALLPWKTVLQNVMLPLRIRKQGAAWQWEERAHALLQMMQLDGFADHFPAQLSGGMRQRVAIARAIACEPDILLMDEAFGALDDFTRSEVHRELVQLCRQRPMTVVLVTHSLPEALLLSDEIVVMAPRPGRISAIVAVEHPRDFDARTRDPAGYFTRLEELERLIHE